MFWFVGLARFCGVYSAMPIPEVIQCYHLTILFSLAPDRALPMNSDFLWMFFVFVGVLLLRCCFCFGSFVLVVSLDCDCCGLCTGPACQSTFCAPILAGLFALIQ